MLQDLFETTKPRILLLVLMSAAIGFVLAAEDFSLMLLLHAIAGTAMVCASCNALNQWMERDVDAKMRRTLKRPLPDGRLSPRQVLGFGCALGMTGIVYLALAVNMLTALVGAVSLGMYLFLYTPLKKRTPLCTLVGAVPGAAPVLMGWAAAGRPLNAEAWALFAIVFLWQMPHFYAIATMYREEYAAAGLPMMPVCNISSANRQTVWYSMGLLAVSLLPTVFGLAGMVYFWGALLLGIAFLGMGVCVWMERLGVSARAHFMSSLFYLPLIFALLLMDKT